MRKIFLDIGSHTGQSVKLFYEDIEDAADWHIVCFDPLYRHYPGELRVNVACISAIVGIENGMGDIFRVPDGGQGATTLKGKTTGGVDYDNPGLAPCIDLVKWFDQHIKDDDFVIVKMNIEGGEYTLMPRLPEILPKIAGMVIKLHHSKFVPDEQAKFLKVYEQFVLSLKDHKAFVFCDPTENPYNFKWLVEQARERQA